MDSVPNLDGMSKDELMSFWAGINKHPKQRAKELFPTMPNGYVKTTKHLASYAANKSAAIHCRLTGAIKGAICYEGICERIYSSLPDYAKW